MANIIVGNREETEGFEITYAGPHIKFHGPAIIALCGAPFEFSINGEKAAMWARHVISAGSEVQIGPNAGSGCRAYLAVLGGLPNVYVEC